MSGLLGDLKPYQQALDELFERHDVALRDYVDTEPLRRIKRRYVMQRFRVPAGRRA